MNQKHHVKRPSIVHMCLCETVFESSLFLYNSNYTCSLVFMKGHFPKKHVNCSVLKKLLVFYTISENVLGIFWDDNRKNGLHYYYWIKKRFLCIVLYSIATANTIHIEYYTRNRFLIEKIQCFLLFVFLFISYLTF